MIKHLFHKNIWKAALVTGCFFVYACENDVEEVKALSSKKLNVEEGKNISTFLSMNGKMRAHLTAPIILRIDGDSGRRSEFPNSLHVDFYNDSTKKIESQLNARYGRYLETENKVYLRDNVVVFNTKGDTLYCEDMYWDQTAQKFYTDRKVTVSQNYGRTHFTGLKGMKASQDFSTISFNEIKENSYFFIPDSTQSSSPTAPVPVKPQADTTKKKP